MSDIKRDFGFDAFRGLAILGVIAIHATGAGYIWKERAGGIGNFWFSVFIRQFLNFSVPAFIFISGYFNAKNKIETLTDYTRFLAKRLSRVLIPYFIWSILMIVLSAIQSGSINTKTIVFKLCTGGATPAYYFMLLISQYYILTPVLVYINKWKYGFYLILLLNLLTLLGFYIIKLYFKIAIPPFLDALPAYTWIAFYQYGLLVGAKSEIEEKISSQADRFIIFTFIGLLLSWIEAILMLRYFQSVDYATTAIKLSSYIYSLSLISLFLWFKTKVAKWNKVILLIGNCSFGIYLIHPISLGIAIYLLQKSWILDSLQPLFQSLAIILTTGVCLGIIYMSRKVLTKKISVKVFGL